MQAALAVIGVLVLLLLGFGLTTAVYAASTRRDQLDERVRSQRPDTVWFDRNGHREN